MLGYKPLCNLLRMRRSQCSAVASAGASSRRPTINTRGHAITTTARAAAGLPAARALVGAHRRRTALRAGTRGGCSDGPAGAAGGLRAGLWARAVGWPRPWPPVAHGTASLSGAFGGAGRASS